MSKTPDEFVYRATLDRIVDGDTFDCILDLGFDVKLHKQRVRLAGIDTPESRINIKKYPERAKEKELGLLAKQKMKEWLVGDITLKSYGTDKYGRVLGTLHIDNININN